MKFFRSDDGLILVVSSTDGYCSLVSFAEGELGTPYLATPASSAKPSPVNIKSNSKQNNKNETKSKVNKDSVDKKDDKKDQEIDKPLDKSNQTQEKSKNDNEKSTESVELNKESSNLNEKSELKVEPMDQTPSSKIEVTKPTPTPIEIKKSKDG